LILEFSHFPQSCALEKIKFFNKNLSQPKVLQALAFTGAYETDRGKFINNVVKSGKMWFKIRYI